MVSLILAAGYATRLGKLTRDKPKALLPIGGKLIIDYLLDDMAALPGLSDVYVVSNHKFIGAFNGWRDGLIARNAYPGLNVHVLDDGSTDDDNKRGAVGDIQFVIESAAIDEELLIAAGDNFFTFPLRAFYDDFVSHGHDTLCATPISDTDLLRSFAVATLDSKRRVTGLIEKPDKPQSDIAVYALYLYRRDTLPLVGEYLAQGYSPDSPGRFPEWLHRRKEVRAYLFQGECYDIGTPAAYEEVTRRFARGKPKV